MVLSGEYITGGSYLYWAEMLSTDSGTLQGIRLRWALLGKVKKNHITNRLATGEELGKGKSAEGVVGVTRHARM